MKIGIIGMGAIGAYLARNLPEHDLVVCDLDAKKAQKAVESLGLKNVKVAEGASHPYFITSDLIVEAASQEAVRLLIPLLSKTDVLIMSVGALADGSLLKELKEAAEQGGHNVFIPSGAVGGLDVLAACNASEVTLETRKSPRSLGREDTEETVLFDGPAREACRLFPKNVNVAATLSLAGIGFDKTRVRIISDPKTSKNTHAVRIAGEAGEYSFTFQNHPLKENPKTSALAAYSALAAIRRLSERIKIG